MDPQAALDDANVHLRQGKRASGDAAMQHYGEAAERIAAYWDWRGGGGFAPYGGDSRAQEIAAELSEEWEKECDIQERTANPGTDHYPPKAIEDGKSGVTFLTVAQWPTDAWTVLRMWEDDRPQVSSVGPAGSKRGANLKAKMIAKITGERIDTPRRRRNNPGTAPTNTTASLVGKLRF